MIICSTDHGIVSFSTDGKELSRALQDRSIRHIARNYRGKLLAIAGENEILRGPQPDDLSKDEGWESAGTIDDLAGNCLLEHQQTLFIGAADARMFTTDMPDMSEITRLESFDRAEGRENWDTPWGGPPDVRSLACIDDPGNPAIYADIHVGGIQRSFDVGKTWLPATGSLHRDVHCVATHPDLPQTVFAATQQGFFRSDDRGESWRGVLEDFIPRNYQRSVVTDALDPDLLLVSASLGPHPDGDSGCEGQLFRSADGGESFRPAHSGLPEHFYHNLDTHLVAASEKRSGLFAFHDDESTLFVTTDGARTWKNVAQIEDVTTVLMT